VSLLTSIFSNNDPAGTLLSWRGWALHDRQTAAFDRLPLAPSARFTAGGPFAGLPPWTAPIREVDGRLGYQVGATWTMDDRVHVRASFWDNNGDPAAFDGFQYAWYTEMLSVGARLKLPRDIEAIAQYMDGTTEMGETPEGLLAVDNRFRAAFVLLTGARGRHRLSGRYDWFDVEDRDVFAIADPNDEDGHAWTLAYLATLNDSARLAVEWLHVTGTRSLLTGVGLPPNTGETRPAATAPSRAREGQLQASLRLTF
jgi:hypothetical protein